MTRLILTGAMQRPPSVKKRAEWSLFEEARILELDTGSGELTCRFRYRTPEPLCAGQQASHVFKAGSWDGERLLLCTQTELLWVDPRDWSLVEHVSHPWFNDLHHVVRLGNEVGAVSTGLDSLVVLDDDKQPRSIRSAMHVDPWQRFDPERDYRKELTTKPHEAHPNFTFQSTEGTWLTRFHQRDAICLDDPGRRIDIGVGHPHDGHFDGDLAWFTTVNGHILAASLKTGTVEQDHDLNEIEGLELPLGWCRAFHQQDGITYVSFTRIRSTQWRRNLSWLRHGFKLPKGYTPLPTRIAAYDLKASRKLAEWNLERAGMNAVFSILPARAPQEARLCA